MANTKSILARIRQSVHRSPLALKVTLLVMIVCSTVALMVLGIGIHKTKLEIQQQQQQAAQLEQENAELEENLSIMDKVQGIVKLARELLGLEDPDAIIVTPEQTTDTQ